jgi:guanylate kinase
MAAHQLHHQALLQRFPRPPGEAEAHHPLPARLLEAGEGQAAQAVLELLGQGAALPLAGGRCNGVHPSRLGLPAELEPLDAVQMAQAQLQAVAAALLRLLETAGQQQAAPLAHRSPQAGEVHRLQPRHCQRRVRQGGAPTLQSTPATAMARLSVITGPSGVGKGTLVSQLLARHPRIWLSVSATTRAPRPGEVEGESYFFLNRERFEQQVADGGFLEWAEFAGNLYGTPREPVEQHLAAGRPVLLEIELEGARQVRRSFPAGFQVMIKPPSFDELERRIRGRATDAEAAIQRRLERARVELEAEGEFDATLVNGELAQALLELEQLLQLDGSPSA